MIHSYVMLVRSVLETLRSVCQKSLSKENLSELERVQKSAFRLILGNGYILYENAHTVP